MREALAAGASDELQTPAHRLKGDGGSYGYPDLTRTAAELETVCGRRDLEAARRHVDQLTTLCQAIRNGTGPAVASGATAP